MKSSREIIIVDHDPASLRHRAEFLRFSGHTVEAASSPWDALLSVKASAPELLITNLFMPHMDGIELIFAVRELERRPKILTLGGTAFPTLDLLGATLTFGADSILHKPFTTAELVTAVESLIGRKTVVWAHSV